jgi:hypothetical protein
VLLLISVWQGGPVQDGEENSHMYAGSSSSKRVSRRIRRSLASLTGLQALTTVRSMATLPYSSKGGAAGGTSSKGGACHNFVLLFSTTNHCVCPSTCRHESKIAGSVASVRAGRSAGLKSVRRQGTRKVCCCVLARMCQRHRVPSCNDNPLVDVRTGARHADVRLGGLWNRHGL